MGRPKWPTEAKELVRRHIAASAAPSRQLLVCELQAACPPHAAYGLRRRAWDRAIFIAVNLLPADWSGSPAPVAPRAPTVLALLRSGSW
jgi:hypothetical protein